MGHPKCEMKSWRSTSNKTKKRKTLKLFRQMQTTANVNQSQLGCGQVEWQKRKAQSSSWQQRKGVVSWEYGAGSWESKAGSWKSGGCQKRIELEGAKWAVWGVTGEHFNYLLFALAFRLVSPLPQKLTQLKEARCKSLLETSLITN